MQKFLIMSLIILVAFVSNIQSELYGKGRKLSIDSERILEDQNGSMKINKRIMVQNGL